MPKKKSGLLTLLDTVRSYWPLLVVLFGIVGTIVTIPSRLSAVEKKAESNEESTQKIQDYIEAIEEQKKAIQASPPGWQWNETTATYIAWPEDPRLKKK